MEQYEKSPPLWLRCDCKEHDLFSVRAQVSWHMAAQLLCGEGCGSAVYSGPKRNPLSAQWPAVNAKQFLMSLSHCESLNSDTGLNVEPQQVCASSSQHPQDFLSYEF